MDDSDNMSTDDNKSVDNISTLRTKPKKRSLVERELETNLTARVTSPVTNSESTSLSRYGRARRLKTEIDSMDMKRLETPKPIEKSPMKVQSPVYKMHASNTPIKIESPKKPAELYLDNQIENIYQENISLSRFASEEIVTSSPLKKKVYIQKDLIQRKDTDSPIMLIKHMFSPDKSSNKLNSHLSNILDRSERFNMNMSKQNGYSLDNSSVVKTLDFDSKKKKKENKDKMPSKNELFELEAKCMYQVGDLAWARMGTYPFWPCIITRDPESGMFVKKKLFGRVEHDIIHVTFFGDNGRRSWIVDNMLRNYTGLAEFESTREQFTAEDKKRDPRLYAAFFISEKKQALWKTSVDEAETLFREPKRFRIDLFNDMLEKSRAVKTTPKLQKKITRTDSDVSLSESLYDSLFSEDDGKVDDTERSRNKSRNKSLDVSEVVTACLDNMAAKTGITKIQKQSHMDRWLQKAKSQTPEKVNVKTQVIKVIKINNNKKWKIIPRDMFKPYSLRRSGNESLTLLFNQNEHDYSKVLPDTLKEETKITDVLKMEPASDLNKLMDVNVEKLDNISCNDDSFNKSNIIELGSKVAVNLDEVNKNAEQEKNLLPTEICLQSNVVCKFIKDKVTSSNEMNIELHRELSNNSFESIEVKNVEEDLLTQSTLTCTPLKIQSDTEIEQQQKINLVSESETQLQEIDPNTDQQNITSFINEASEIQRTPNVHTMNKSHENDVKKIDSLSCDCEANDDENKVIIQLDVENTTDKLENSKPSEDKNHIGSINDIDIQTKEPEQQSKDNSKISENCCDVNDDSNKGITNVNESTVNKHIETKYVEQGTKNYLLKKIGLQNEAGSEAVKLQLEGDNESKIITTNNYENMSNEPEDNTSTLVSNLETNKVTPVPKIHNKLIENIKESHYIENYYHDSDSQDFKDSDDDFDIDAVSVNSEDSVVSLNKTDKYYKRKLRAKADRPLEDPDFLQYLEMRQDSLTDENPGLTDDEIITYLYKTYLYEESQKSDLRKTDDIEQSSMVKGLNDRINKKNRVSKSIRECLFEKKKNKIIKKDLYEEADNASVTSDSDVSWSNENVNKSELVVTMLDKVNSKGDRIMKITKVNKEVINPTRNNSINCEAKQTLLTDYIDLTKKSNESKPKVGVSESIKEDKVKRIKKETDLETESIIIDSETESLVSEEMDVPLIFRKTRSTVRENVHHKEDNFITVKDESDNVYVNSEKTDILLVKKKKIKSEKNDEHKVNIMENLEFVQYLELRQDTLIEENPQLTHDEIVQYLHKTWLFEEEKKSEQKKADEIEQSGLVKGLKQVAEKSLKIKFKKKHTIDVDDCNDIQREKPKRKASKPFYNEEYTDLEDELEFFEIFKQKTVKTVEMSKENLIKISNTVKTESKPLETGSETVPQDENESWADEGDEVEFYFEQLTQPKPNIFKGLIREKVCEICEAVNNLIKCKSCHGMFHIECIRKVDKVIKPDAPTRGRKKKKGRKHKNLEDSESQSDEKGLDVSEEQNLSIEENEPESFTVNADIFEHQLSAKMKEVLENIETINYDSYSSDDGIDWIETVPGKCEIIDIKLKRREKPIDYSNFKCNNCRKYDTPVCFVCKSATSKTGNDFRQKCNIAHCYKYYHLECLDHWPQTQFNAGEIYKNNKKVNDNKYFEALTCPRHVCHTCVSDDPRGCKTRFSGDKLARCVRCPATYHSFTKCLPAGTKILTGSNVICPRHYEHRPGKVPCHVNTGWCFICALGGTLICCEYCPTSFHAECLNIDPPEGGYMCEDCETGRLPLYGEMVWVKLGNYRWWPGLILHPSEIPENIMSVRHSLGEFVVRFFGQYDYYWVNRGRVFPFQEGDSGRVSSQKSKIDAAFTTAMEHAQRACFVARALAEPNEEESLDIASSLLPPHYVKLKTNKPVGSVCMKKMDDPELSLTQCECDPNEEDPCGPYSQCLNRMLLTECGPTCRAGDRCNNRAFEKRLYPKLTPYRTHHRGWGLKTLEDIKAGQFVIEYVGELIDEEEFQRRMRRKHEIRDENYYFLTLDKERMIDAGPKGNLARFMNHCCEPNCETQKWTVLGDVRVGLFAIHNIPADSEVTFNYNLECAGIEKKRCLCGTKRCSGYMGAKPKQDESQTKKNKLQNKRTYKKHKPDESPSTSKPQKRLGRPRKNKELTELEKDLLIIKSATNLSSDDSDFVDRPKVLKRKRMSFSSDDKVLCDSDSSNKRSKTEVGD
ncbi:hypothetical protein K1T71_013709 [Dendrolimus kikuchii]|uniref:Uncharacterized protein n=1 Tax=Dendrolimus kikuchii TaxID=765133 RepID=A0ACC1CHJ0_9NEOP|nr:hypothetical protein K1T71_013709 [Dendrolimus kikuchii]